MLCESRFNSAGMILPVTLSGSKRLDPPAPYFCLPPPRPSAALKREEASGFFGGLIFLRCTESLLHINHDFPYLNIERHSPPFPRVSDSLPPKSEKPRAARWQALLTGAPPVLAAISGGRSLWSSPRWGRFRVIGARAAVLFSKTRHLWKVAIQPDRE